LAHDVKISVLRGLGPSILGCKVRQNIVTKGTRWGRAAHDRAAGEFREGQEGAKDKTHPAKADLQ
jgi:hypothetical protein